MTSPSGERATARLRPHVGRPCLLDVPTRSRGQSLVEFTLVVPILILILLIAVDFGRLFFSYVQITNAAREGANYGITRPDDTSGITARVMQETNVQSQQNGSAGPINVATTCSPDSCSAARTSQTQNVVQVTVTRSFSFLTPVIGSFLGNVTLTASASSVAVGKAGVPVTPPPCVTVPNVVGLTPANASAAIIAAGLVPSGTDAPPNGGSSVLSQIPAAWACVSGSATVVSYRY
jgi:Flp pilus assembly protein TadG